MPGLKTVGPGIYTPPMVKHVFASMACGVCGHVLDRLTDPDGQETWLHVLDDDMDHPVVPVSVDDIRTEYLCDFCLAPNARWELPVETYPIGTGHFNAGNWSACDVCAGLLAEDQWDQLTSRARTSQRKRQGVANTPPREAFVYMYEQLRPHVLGPVRLTETAR